MQHQGVAGHELADFFQAFKVEFGFALKFIRPVAGTDGDGQGVAARALHKLHGLVRVGVNGFFRGDFVFHTGQPAELGLHPDAARPGVIHHFFGQGDVFFEGQVRAVDHHRGETAVNAGLADGEVLAVVEVEHEGQVAFQKGRFHQLDQIILPGVFARAGGHLKNGRGLLFRGRFNNALDDFHIIDVESAHGVAFFVGSFKQKFGTDQGHGSDLRSVKVLRLLSSGFFNFSLESFKKQRPVFNGSGPVWRDTLSGGICSGQGRKSPLPAQKFRLPSLTSN